MVSTKLGVSHHIHDGTSELNRLYRLLQLGNHCVKEPPLTLVEGAFNSSSSGSLVPPSAKFFCQLATIQFTATAKTDFIDTGGLFHQNHCGIGALNCKTEINQIFRVGWYCARIPKVLQTNKCMSQAAFKFNSHPLQHGPS